MNDLPYGKAMAADFAACREYTRHHAKTFYFASHVLPKAKRLAAYALYSFCRRADDLVDSPEALADPSSASRELAHLRDQLARTYALEEWQDPMLRAFQVTVIRYEIPQEYFLDLLRGVEMDLTKKRYATWAELEEYCYCVASTVGLIMTRVFGAADEPAARQHAIDLGKAMQLTNILRDVGEDHRRGRMYIPAEELVLFDVREEDVAHGRVTQEFIRLMQFQMDRARALYKSADEGIPLLTNDGSRFCVTLMRRTYAEILSVIEANNSDVVTRRAYVPLARKFQIAMGAYYQSPESAHVL